jgi:sulfoxide reductase heme-binding subunit YedZ
VLESKPARQRTHIALIGLALLPLVGLVLGAARGALGANPVETITHVTGEWALRLLLLTLAVSPLRRLAGCAFVAPWRRSLGLLAFGYACLHFATFLALDLGFDLSALGEEMVERPFVTLGFAALVLLTPLAVTSTRGWQRRLGRRWLSLHRLVYVAAVLAVLHFFWLVKADWAEPIVYGAVLAGLLALRFRH